MGRRTRVLAPTLVCLLAVGSAFAITSGEKVKSKGVIINRVGDNITVKTPDGDFTVVLLPDTKIQQPVGLIGTRRKDMPAEVLIPGLKLSFEGVGDDQGKVQAKKVEFDSDALALAQVIQAGLNPTAQQQAQNMQT